MKDQRIAHYRAAFDSLAEALSATARVCRWEGPESAPEHLRQTATKVFDRLGTANRLTTGNLVGRPDVVARLTRIRTAIQRLDTAYVEYRRSETRTPAERAQAAATLELEIGDAETEARGDA